MKKFTLLIMLIAALCVLVSCGKDGDVPEGLDVVEISEEYGFRFYCPEGWYVINSKVDSDKPIFGAKMSSYTNISITLAPADMPAGLAEAPDSQSALAAIKAYFEKSAEEFPEGMKLTVVSEPTLANFGNASEAYKCVYTYKYEKYDFACMQYFVRNGGDFYIFTYTSYGDTEDESSDYRVYLEKIEPAITNFTFTEKSGGENADTTVYETDDDGYNLVSDRKIAGFDLFLPSEVEVIVSDGYVTAKISENACIYIGKATATGVQINQYWENRKVELQRIADEGSLVEIEVNKVNKSETDKKVVLGDLPEHRVASYEFTYAIDGVTYHVYQVMGVDTFNGYVFTYTAKEEDYVNNLELIDEILAKVKF